VGEKEHGVQIHGYNPVLAVLGNVRCEAVTTHRRDAGVVVEDVDPTQETHRLVDQVLRLRPVTGIGRDADRLATRRAESGDGGLGRGRVDVADDDPGALTREGERAGAPEARAGAGDDGDAILEAHVTAYSTSGGRAGQRAPAAGPRQIRNAGRAAPCELARCGRRSESDRLGALSRENQPQSSRQSEKSTPHLSRSSWTCSAQPWLHTKRAARASVWQAS